MQGYGLTPAEGSMLTMLKGYLNGHGGVSPSYEEIRRGLGLKSKSGVARLITSLERKGHIRRLAYRSRSISIVDHQATHVGNYCSTCGAPSSRDDA